MLKLQSPRVKKWREGLRKIKRRLMARHLREVRIAFLAFSVLVVFFIVYLVKLVFGLTGFGQYWGVAQAFLFKPEGILENFEGRTNILLLGKAGSASGPILTDTIILISVSHNGGDVVMVSVPRDIWVPEIDDKVNSAYFKGNEKGQGKGLVLAKSVVKEILGVPIHYTLALDFDGFVRVIDILGGVEVFVENAFTDKKFPIPGLENDECGGDLEYRCRYETIEFSAGKKLMDGATALKFARSRYSEDPLEGNDLARTARQQKVVLAIKEKISLKETYLSIPKMRALWETFWEITETDMTRFQVSLAARLIFDSKENLSYTIPEEYLVNPQYSVQYRNLYIFLPKEGSWRSIHSWVAGLFTMPK